MKFFENIAISPTTTGIYQSRRGEVKRPIMHPVTRLALGKNGLILRSSTNKRSNSSVDPTDNVKTRITFNDGLLKNAVIKIRVRRNPI